MFKNETRRKQSKQGLRLRTFLSFLLFTGIFIAFLWVFQTIYLGTFYQTVKKNESKRVLQKAANIVTSEETRLFDVSKLSKDYDVQILLTDENGVVFYSSSEFFSLFQEIPVLSRYYERALQSQSGFTVTAAGDARGINFPRLGEWEKPNEQEDKGQISLISCKVVSISGRSYLLVLTSLITPIESTVSTLRLILVAVSVGMLFVSILMSTVLSRSLSRPIERMNREAKGLVSPEKAKFTDSRIVEISELSDTLNYAASELAKTEKLQQELIANVSHDLRTPLTMIKGYAEVMRDIPGENTAENLQVVIDETERLSVLVSDLLDVSKMQAGVTNLNLSEYDLTSHIEKVLERFSKMNSLEGYSIQFVKNCTVYTKADGDKMDQVLYNLVNNAINYSGDEKRIEVCQEVSGSQVKISVRDFGPGIKEEELPFIWQRYYRSTEMHKLEKHGSGLGLSIVKNVLELHHAPYGVSSSKEEGTTFWFVLPKIK